MNIRIHIENNKKGYNLKAYKRGVRKLIGTCDLLEFSNKKYYLLTGLGVKHKNKGLGSLLVKVSQQLVKPKKKRILLCAVPTKLENKERLIKFYKRFGFRRFNKLKDKGWMIW